MYDCVSYVYISEVTCRGRKRALDSLEIKLQATEHECCETNSDSLQDWYPLLTTDVSFWP